MKKISIIKNDPYRIKRWIFRYRLERHIRKRIKVYTKLLRNWLLLSCEIGYPDTEEKKGLLKKVIPEYDDTVLKLEEHMNYKRSYLDEPFSLREKKPKLHYRK